ncbi:type I-E CRISPR-associated protein Cse2/CasB [Providencia rettgeri]
MDQIQETKQTKEQSFINFVIDRCKKDKGFAAKLRRADNPATEYQSWEILGPWVDLDNKFQRLPYATIGAAMTRVKLDTNGTIGLGKAIALAYAEKGATNYSDQAKARLRRLLACNDIDEACRVIRPILSLVQSKVIQPLDYAKLLGELCYFGEKTKIRWAQDFYAQRSSEKQEVNV